MSNIVQLYEASTNSAEVVVRSYSKRASPSERRASIGAPTYPNLQASASVARTICSCEDGWVGKLHGGPGR